MRLVKYLAHAGVASRRAAGDLVQEGLVKINGRVNKNVAYDVQPDDDVVFRGEHIRLNPEPLILMLHKPRGIVCSMSDPHNPETVRQFLPEKQQDRLKPIGRLDKHSTGLLLLTDNGDLAHRLMHPSHEITKTYRTTVNGIVSRNDVQKLEEGVELEDGKTFPAEVKVLKKNSKINQTLLDISIHEGRNRQVRRMCKAIGHTVRELKRVRYGPLLLGELREGEIRKLLPQEEKRLYKIAGLKKEKSL